MPVIFIKPRSCSGRRSCSVSSSELCCVCRGASCPRVLRLSLQPWPALVHKPVGFKEQGAASVCFCLLPGGWICLRSVVCYTSLCLPRTLFFPEGIIEPTLHVLLQKCICSSAHAQWQLHLVKVYDFALLVACVLRYIYESCCFKALNF